jgi:hypothetical protein
VSESHYKPGAKSTPALPGGAQPAASPGQAQAFHACIIAVVAAGAWLVGVRPLELKLAAKQAQLTDVQTQLATFEAGLVNEAPLEEAIDSLTVQAQEINSWTASSGDASRLYDAFRALASRNSVRIERVEPSSSSRNPGSKPRAANATEIFGYTIEITGTYPAVARFMDACEQELGVTKVVSFHMSASANAGAVTSTDPQITATIETSHLKFSIPGVAAPTPKPLPNAAAESGS